MQPRSHAATQPSRHVAATEATNIVWSLGCALVSHRFRKDGTTTAEREGHADAVEICDAMKLEGSSCPPGTKAMKQQATQLSHPSFSICSAHDANRMVCGAPQTDEALFQHHLDQWSRRRHDESAREGDNSEGVPSRAKTCQDLHRWLRQVNLRCGQGESSSRAGQERAWSEREGATVRHTCLAGRRAARRRSPEEPRRERGTQRGSARKGDAHCVWMHPQFFSKNALSYVCTHNNVCTHDVCLAKSSIILLVIN